VSVDALAALLVELLPNENPVDVVDASPLPLLLLLLLLLLPPPAPPNE
tara:strand:- start:2099 stop:2242 length:144 start_codon:yes stop_codon:yes gene_type:complete